MITIAQAAKFIEARESRRLGWYPDSEGNPTIGVGFNLDRAGAAEALKAIGVTKEQIMRGRKLTHAEVDILLTNDVRACLSAARAHVRTFAQQPDAVQLMLVDQIFNMGLSAFAEFKRYRTHLAAGRYDAAAGELMFEAPPNPELTDYYKKTKSRAIGHIATLHGLGNLKESARV